MLQDTELKMMNASQCEAFQREKLHMTEDVCISASHALYTNILGFTKGTVRSRTLANPKGLAFPSYRDVCCRGRNATKTNIVLMQAEVLCPKPATKIADIEDKLAEQVDQQWRAARDHVSAQQAVGLSYRGRLAPGARRESF